MAALSSQRFLVFTGKGGPSFPEFVMNFKLATAVTNLDETQKRSTFFSHFDGNALSHLYRNPDILKMPLDEAIATLKKHYVKELPINPARIGLLTQEPDESVTDFLRRMTEAMHCMREDPPPNMSADEAQIYEVTKEAQAIQAQAFIKPYFMDGIRPELKSQLGRLFELKLPEMARELDKYELFQKEYPPKELRDIPRRQPYGVAMVECGEVSSNKAAEEATEKEEMMESFNKWYLDRKRINPEQYQEWKNGTDVISRRPPKANKNKGRYERAVNGNNVNQVAMANAKEVSPSSPSYSTEVMQKATEVLKALNPPQPTMGVLPMQPSYQLTQMIPNGATLGTGHPSWGYPSTQQVTYPFNPPQFNNQNNGQGGQPPNWKGEGELLFCTYCKKHGRHTKPWCRQRLRDEYQTERAKQERINQERGIGTGHENPPPGDREADKPRRENNFLRREGNFKRPDGQYSRGETKIQGRGPREGSNQPMETSVNSSHREGRRDGGPPQREFPRNREGQQENRSQPRYEPPAKNATGGPHHRR
jgi:hypothetical protein